MTGNQARKYTPPTPSPSPPTYPTKRVQQPQQPKPILIPSRPTPLPSPPKTPSPLAHSSNPLSARSDTLDVLSRLFPRSAVSLLPHTRGVQIFSQDEGMSVRWDGVVLGLPGGERGLYVDAGEAEDVHLKEWYVPTFFLSKRQ